MNTNSASALAVALIGYMPFLDVPAGFHDHKRFKQAKHHLKQACIGHVLDNIESRALHGFRCVIGGVTTVCFPRVGAMSLDTPERVTYFGLRNQGSCALCRKRAGRSTTRTSTLHDPDAVKRLYAAATLPNEEVRTRRAQRDRKKARLMLRRHGLDYEKRCRLDEHANRCLVRIPSIGPRLYGGLCRMERMHIYFIGYCTYTMELLVQCVPKKNYHLVRAVLTQCHQFRDPFTGTTHPRLPNLMKMTHLTAERRVRAIFYWAHVLGVKAEIIEHRDIRRTAQIAVAMLQVILIAVRGHRSYTMDELNMIFREVGAQFFRALEELAEFFANRRYARRQQDHARDPDRYAPPRSFTRMRRCRIRVLCMLSTSFCKCPLCHLVNALYVIMQMSSTSFRKCPLRQLKCCICHLQRYG